MKIIFYYIKIIIIFIFILLFLFFLYDIFPDFFREKSTRTALGARFFVSQQEFTPAEARKMVIEKARKNHKYKRLDNNYLWLHMHVIGNEYFFAPVMARNKLKEEGYYVDPKSREIRYVNNDYYFRFPLFYDRCAIVVFRPKTVHYDELKKDK